MLASMGAFAVADALVKVSTAVMSPAQVMFYLLSGALIIFTFMALMQKDKLLDVRAFSAILLLRYVTEIIGMIGMIMALALVPISVVGAITQATPLLAAVGAVVFLKEHVGWRRWCSIIVGFIGVLLIVQPEGVEFDYAILWAILAMVSMSIRDLTTRLIPSDISSASLATYTMVAATLFAVAWVMYNGESFLAEHTNWRVVIPMIVLGSLGYILLIFALRIAEVSVVMPFRYSRIIYLLLLGVLVFDEKPSLRMLIGAALIIASGTYMMWREHLAKTSQSGDSLPK